jgi:hypothetical protein
MRGRFERLHATACGMRVGPSGPVDQADYSKPPRADLVGMLRWWALRKSRDNSTAIDYAICVNFY